MAYIKISELNSLSSAQAGDVLPIVNEGQTKKITVASLVNLGSIPSLSSDWNSTYTTVNSLSETWEESAVISPLQNASGGWDSAYTTVNSLSDTWEESAVISPLQTASGGWDSVYSTVKSLSDTWEESAVISPLQNASGFWNAAYTNLINNSAAYLLSGTDVYLGDVPVLSGNWNSTYSTVKSNSAIWGTGGIPLQFGDVPVLSSGWNSNYSTVNSNSSVWNGTYTTLKNNSAIWNGTYTTVNTNSANWSNFSVISSDTTPITIDSSNSSTYLNKILHVRSATDTRINFESSIPSGWNVVVLNESTANVTLTSSTDGVYLSFGNVLSGSQGSKKLYTSATVYKYGANIFAIGSVV